MNFVSAYRHLSAAEKQFTDGFVSALETRAVKASRRIIELLDDTAPVSSDPRENALLERPLVRAAIAERVREIQDAADLTAYRVLKELSAIAFSNINDYMLADSEKIEGHNVNFISWDLAKCTREQMGAIQSIKVEYDASGLVVKKLEFKLHDKVAGLDRFMRYMGLLDPENPHYRAENAKIAGKKEPLALAVGTTQTQAANAYAQFIEG